MSHYRVTLETFDQGDWETWTDLQRLFVKETAFLWCFYISFHIHFCLYLKTNNHPVVWSFPRSSFLFPRQILRGLSLDNSTFSARHKATLRFLRYLASQYNYVTTFLLDKMKSIKYIPLLKTTSWGKICLLKIKNDSESVS